nr:hypothetical protein [Tanacetum cinerariifolium]
DLRVGGVKVMGVSCDFVANNSNQPEDDSKCNVDTRTTGADRQHDEVHARFENTLNGYFLVKKVAFLVVERYILNAWQKYGDKRVMGDKNAFAFILFSCETGLEGDLKHGPWLIRNALFILRKQTLINIYISMTTL